MTIDILVVAYCGWNALAETLASIALWSEPGYRLTVVENSVRNYPLTSLWNRFIEKSTRDVVALCNPDILVGPAWDTEALGCFQQNDACGVVSPISNTAPHRAQLSSTVPGEMTLADIPRVAAMVKEKSGNARFYFTDDERMAPAHCVLIRRDAWSRAAGFDERLPFAGNDYDFNRRVVAAGMTIAVATAVFSYHHWGVSTSDALRLGQFDAQRNEPRFRPVMADVGFEEL